MSKLKDILGLFLTMMKIGLFTFGGGLSMISLFEHEFVEKKKYLDSTEFLNIVAIAESTPGPIAINSSTYIGYKKAGVLGALFATLGVCIPSFAIIFVISLFFNNFIEIEYVAYAFNGIQACVIFLILSAGVKLFLKSKKSLFNILVISVTVACMITLSLLSVSFSSIFYILIFGVLAFVIYLVKQFAARKTDRGKEEDAE